MLLVRATCVILRKITSAIRDQSENREHKFTLRKHEDRHLGRVVRKVDSAIQWIVIFLKSSLDFPRIIKESMYDRYLYTEDKSIYYDSRIISSNILR